MPHNASLFISSFLWWNPMNKSCTGSPMRWRYTRAKYMLAVFQLVKFTCSRLLQCLQHAAAMRLALLTIFPSSISRCELIMEYQVNADVIGFGYAA